MVKITPPSEYMLDNDGYRYINEAAFEADTHTILSWDNAKLRALEEARYRALSAIHAANKRMLESQRPSGWSRTIEGLSGAPDTIFGLKT
jgi:hypothetical protein